MKLARLLALAFLFATTSPLIINRVKGEDGQSAPSPTGRWFAQLASPGGALRFGLWVDRDDDGSYSARIVNGAETITVNQVEFQDGSMRIAFPHYDSLIEAKWDAAKQTLNGRWEKVSGKGKASRLAFTASRRSSQPAAEPHDLARFQGVWRIDFSSSEDPAVGRFKVAEAKNDGDPRPLRGTIMTTTGDYRFLAGNVVDGALELSVFDGAHAFLFRGRTNQDGQVEGDFWSRDSWHETWRAKRDPAAKLPDAFAQTRWVGDANLAALKFPDLDGKQRSLADPMFASKVRIITIFGSWCPNCHDSALYLADLHRRYGKQGLSIVGLAFELTGDFERDAEQVRRYLKRHKTPYPVLLAGLADKRKASEQLPILDRVRSYPTTIFLNEKNEVISIHTGFTGPATGEDFDRLKARFEAIIEQQLRL